MAIFIATNLLKTLQSLIIFTSFTLFSERSNAQLSVYILDIPIIFSARFSTMSIKYEATAKNYKKFNLPPGNKNRPIINKGKSRSKKFISFFSKN